MAEVTSQDFQKLLEEQKKTTKALDKVSMLQKENVDVGKDNLKQGELFGPQTEEQSKQTTKVEELKDVNKSYFQQIIDKISGWFSLSYDKTVGKTWTSFIKPDGNKGLIGLSINLEIRVSASVGLASLLKYPPGILPAA